MTFCQYLLRAPSLLAVLAAAISADAQDVSQLPVPMHLEPTYTLKYRVVERNVLPADLFAKVNAAELESLRSQWKRSGMDPLDVSVFLAQRKAQLLIRKRIHEVTLQQDSKRLYYEDKVVEPTSDDAFPSRSIVYANAKHTYTIVGDSITVQEGANLAGISLFPLFGQSLLNFDLYKPPVDAAALESTQLSDKRHNADILLPNAKSDSVGNFLPGYATFNSDDAKTLAALYQPSPGEPIYAMEFSGYSPDKNFGLASKTVFKTYYLAPGASHPSKTLQKVVTYTLESTSGDEVAVRAPDIGHIMRRGDTILLKTHSFTGRKEFNVEKNPDLRQYFLPEETSLKSRIGLAACVSIFVLACFPLVKRGLNLRKMKL